MCHNATSKVIMDLMHVNRIYKAAKGVQVLIKAPVQITVISLLSSLTRIVLL